MAHRRGQSKPAPWRGRRDPRAPTYDGPNDPLRMEHIASVSRSSGMEKGGDALKDPMIQEQYRDFIETKWTDIKRKFVNRPLEKEAERKQRIDAQENLLILFRKLREGISASQRNGHFALEVYETSFFLAVLFDAPRHSTAILPALVPAQYLSCPAPHHNKTLAVLASCLHQLIMAFPSQLIFHDHLQTIPSSILDQTSPERKWIKNVASSLRALNYSKFERLTLRSSLTFLDDTNPTPADLPQIGTLSLATNADPALARQAFYSLLDQLRRKASEASWKVLRSAYRELACEPSSPTREWLVSSLHLNATQESSKSKELDDWLQEQAELGHLRRKEAVDGRWIVCKAR